MIARVLTWVAGLALLLAQTASATVEFSFVNGFQTDNPDDKLYLKVMATSDDNSIVVQTESFPLPFDSSVRLAFENTNKYVTFVVADIYKEGSTQSLAHFATTGGGTRLWAYNFLLIAHTDMDRVTPKLSVLTAGDSTKAANIAIGNFYPTQGKYYPPTPYPVYAYPSYDYYGSVPVTSAMSMPALTHSTWSTSIYATNESMPLFVETPVSQHKYCPESGSCITSASESYSGPGQMFATLMYGNKDAKMGFVVPPNVLGAGVV